MRHDLGSKSVVLLAEEYLRKNLPKKSRSEFCGKRSSEHRSIAARNEAACKICSAATKRRGTLLAESIGKQKRGFTCAMIWEAVIPLAPSLRVSRRILAKSPVGSLPPANLGMPHCSGHSLTEARFLPRETVPQRGERSHLILASSSGRWHAVQH